MGSLVVLASHDGAELLGAEQMMADAFAKGERVGVIVLDETRPAHGVQPAVGNARMQHIVDCQVTLQALLGQVPPLLMLPCPLPSVAAQDQPDLAETSMLGGFLQSIGARTLLVTDPGHSDPAYEAALKLASRIISAGLAERLVVVPIGQPAQAICGLSGWGDEGIGAETSLVSPRREQYRFAFRAACEPVESSFRHSADKAARCSGVAAAMGDRWYPDILELGCSEGDFTSLLAAHCSHLLTLDASQTALDVARLRAGGALNVELRRGGLPDDVPADAFDLIVLNDCLHDLELSALTATANRLPLLCKEGGRIVIAMRHESAAQDMTAQVATELLIAELPGWTGVFFDQSERSRIHVLERR